MHSALNKIIPWLWAAVWFTLPFPPPVNSVSMIVLGIVLLVRLPFHKPSINRKEIILAGLFFLFFIWHAAGFLFDPDTHAVWQSLARKFSYIAIPLIMILLDKDGQELGKWAIRGFFAGLLVSGAHMLSLALVKIISGGSMGTFIYHNFMGPYILGPIYYSWYLSVALCYLALRKPEKAIKKFRFGLGTFFLVLLLFCVSKLFIIVTIPVLLWSFLKNTMKLQGRERFIIPLAVVVILAAGSVPILHRLSSLKNTKLEIVEQEKYSYNTPLNGLTFRMVLWRLAGNIMVDEKAWLTGTGIGSRQDILDSYYKKFGLYTGNQDIGDTGYLGYNFHSQYLETMIGTGIPGLILLFSILSFIFFTKSSKLFFPLIVYVFIMIFFLTESVLERQAGIVFFSLIWMMQVYKPINTETSWNPRRQLP